MLTNAPLPPPQRAREAAAALRRTEGSSLLHATPSDLSSKGILRSGYDLALHGARGGLPLVWSGLNVQMRRAVCFNFFLRVKQIFSCRNLNQNVVK